MSTDSDSDVIRYSAENPAVFGELYERHAAPIHRYAVRRVGASAADDVLSDTFLVAFERRSHFDLAWADARPWLFGIATNLIRKHHREEKRELRAVMSSTIDLPVDDTAAVGQRVDAERAVRGIGQALRKLPARDRDVLLLFAWGGLSYEEIAHATGAPIGTVRSRLNRARTTLRIATTSGAQASPKEMNYGRVDASTQNS
jgi:RNA polymerase sigma-70 factor (ECF subfamily)